MRVLLDECVPGPTAKLLPDHDCRTVQQLGWAGTKNGALLSRAEGQFDVFLTSDQNLRYEQNLSARRIAVIQLSTNNLKTIQARAHQVREAVASAVPGEVLTVAL